MRRRTFLAGTAAAAAGAAGALWVRQSDPARAWLRDTAPARAWSGASSSAGAWVRDTLTGGDPPPVVPSAPPGAQRVTKRRSAARGTTVDVYTAVPAGYGDGRGLPVCLILHGGAKRPPDYPLMGLGGFLTDAIRRGTPPFVLAGATGGLLGWQPNGADDPQRMLHDEMPAWCAADGFDATRVAAWGWSLGGYGALLLAESFPGFLRAAAVFSPAVSPGDPVFTGAGRLAGTPVGLWCGLDDPLALDVRSLQQTLPAPPAAGGYGPGRHNFSYWSTLIPAAFDFIGAALGRSAG
jgi:Putative esterase